MSAADSLTRPAGTNVDWERARQQFAASPAPAATGAAMSAWDTDDTDTHIHLEIETRPGASREFVAYRLAGGSWQLWAWHARDFTKPGLEGRQKLDKQHTAPSLADAVAWLAEWPQVVSVRLVEITNTRRTRLAFTSRGD